MPPEPLKPLDPGLADAYRDAAEGLLRVARVAAADRDLWSRPTECPGWTVGDIVAHVVGLERDLDGWPRPKHQLPEDLPHVRDELGRWMELPVDYRRGRPPSAVLAELTEILPRRTAAVQRLVAAGDDVELPGLLGRPTSASRLIPMRIFDLWAHEQDIRRAIDRPGHLTCPAADVAAGMIATALPHVVAKKAALPPGNVVRVTVEGQTSLQTVVEVAGDGHGRLVDPRTAHSVPSVEIDMDWETLLRLASGRVTYDDVADEVYVEGNRAAGRAVLRSMTITP